MVAGEFTECYDLTSRCGASCGHHDGQSDHYHSDHDESSNMPASSTFDAVVTCFFIDTAKNPLQYIRHIALMLSETRGVWINCGPLLYHFADSLDEMSIELSVEELRDAIAVYFDFVDDKMIDDCRYCVQEQSLSYTTYSCWFFAAIRNDRPLEGSSHKVY